MVLSWLPLVLSSASKVMRCRPGGTATVGPLGAPSSCTFTAGGRAPSVICTAASVATAVVDDGNEASPVRPMSTVRLATPVRCSVRCGSASAGGPSRQTSSAYKPAVGDPLPQLDRGDIAAGRRAGDDRIVGNCAAGQLIPGDGQRKLGHVAVGEGGGLGLIRPEVQMCLLLLMCAENDVVHIGLPRRRAVFGRHVGEPVPGGVRQSRGQPNHPGRGGLDHRTWDLCEEGPRLHVDGVLNGSRLMRREADQPRFCGGDQEGQVDAGGGY